MKSLTLHKAHPDVTMDIKATKRDLINWLEKLEDPEVLAQLSVIKNGQDWWEEIGEEEKLAIDEGLAELDRGEGVPHEKVMKSLRERLNV